VDVLVAVKFLQRRHDVLFIVTTKFVFHSTDVSLFACLFAAFGTLPFFVFF
jgi:hypothetical protein